MYKNVKETSINIFFKIVYLVHLFLSLLVYTAGNKVTLILLLVCGGIIGIYRVFRVKKYLKFHGVFILVAFVISYIISNLLFVKYGVSEQVQMLVWIVFQFFLVYTNNVENAKNDIHKEIEIISYAIVVLSTIASAISVWMLISGCSTFVTAVSGKRYILGISSWGRLFGIYNEPNYASVFTLVGIFLGWMLLKQVKNCIVKTSLIFSSIVQVIYIIFVQSRTAQVCIIIGCISLLVCKTLEKLSVKNIIKNIAISLGVVVVVLVGFPKVISLYNSIDFNMSIGENSETILEETDIEIGRESMLSEDISNRRFDIWMSSLEFIKKEPILGVGFRNIVPYAKDNLPTSYMLTNDHATFDSFHNTVVDITVAQGIVGLIIAVMLVVSILKFIVVKWRCLEEKEKDVCVYLLSIAIMIAASAMFLSHVFYVNILTTFCFWLILGYLVLLLSKANSDVEAQNLDKK